MEIRPGRPEDLASWMELVREVRRNFPGLETGKALGEHERTVLGFMEDGRALCAAEGEEIAGVLLFSRRHSRICCLAVKPAYRRRGIASLLMEKALREMDGGREVTVSTFREGDPKGAAARAFYERFGFTEGELTEEFGYPCQVFRRTPARGAAADKTEEEKKVKREKSCGAVIFTEKDGNRLYLVEVMRKGHLSLCKGHVEGTETEHETAAREIREETGLTVKFLGGFRRTIEYSPYPNCMKTVVFFLAEADGTDVTAQEEEVREIRWLPFGEAVAALTFESDRETLRKAEARLADRDGGTR